MIEEPIKYITKVEIQGLWGHYDIIWNLNKDVNVLAGGNGSGKSTIFNCVFDVISEGSISNKYLGTVHSITLSFNNQEKLFYSFYKTSDEKPFVVEIIKDAIEKKTVTFHGKDSAEECRGFLLPDDLSEIFNINLINTFDTELKSQELLQKVDNDTKTELDFELWKLQKEYLNYQVNLGKKLKANKGNPDDNSTYFQDKFLEIVDNLFSETHKKVNRDKNELEFLLGDKEINAYQLSSGEKQLLIILLTVLVQDNKPSILLMDEPEISLHIEWQRKLIKYIRELNPNAQVIVATHSPDIVPDGCLDKIFNLQDLIVKDNFVP